jgi:4-aminobutyrate aminotransferase-like enzyme
MEPDPPIFWEAARGANVRDVDGNEFVDLTGGFAVATAGHSNVAVAATIAAQAAELAHGLGDVHPSAVKVALLEKLAEITPQPLQISILGSAGAEAVEAALKTAWLHTKRTDVIAFEGSYHGLTMGALAVTQRPEFREPFCTQLNPHVRFAPFPTNTAQLAPALQTLDSLLDDDVAAILVEPIQGRGGIRMPAANFLGELRARCDGRTRVLIFDEIYTGMGRTGRWFACEHWNVVPDLMTIGKGLTGSIALSACIGTTEVMSSWPASTGEAIHTSTFLGNPIACAAALAQIREIEQRSLLQRAQSIGTRIERRTSGWPDRFPELLEVGGLGALQGLRFSAASPSIAIRVCAAALQRGVIALAEGPLGEVLALTPPLVVTDEQLDHALTVLEELLFRER